MACRLFRFAVAMALAWGLGFGAVTVHASDLTCLIHPHATITITAPLSAVIESITVERGDLVKEGQVLATLDSSVERSSGAVAAAEAEMSNHYLADLQLQRTAAEVARRTIRSPINGVVVERYMSAGEYPKEEKIFKLAQIHPLRVEVYAPIAMLGKVHVGQEAIVKPEDPIAGTYKAKVTIVDRVIDAGSGTVGIRLELPNPDLKVPAGLKCTARFNSK